jgi:hypothetical protein
MPRRLKDLAKDDFFKINAVHQSPTKRYLNVIWVCFYNSISYTGRNISEERVRGRVGVTGLSLAAAGALQLETERIKQ